MTLFADYVLTFGAEVEHVWKRRISAATILFFLIRYITLAERIVLTISLFLQTADNSVS